MMDSQAKGLIKGLENWAKRVTTGYKDVNVQNMSSSFRNGLAFCAIIHHYRPDLIDFDSLSKENIFENNSLAFSTAEKQLGVPALLEAKDMVDYSQPDRLSIITYLSQLHNCFENQNKVRALQSGFKRPQNNSAGPPSKVSYIQPKLLSSNRNDTCNVCNHRVFILERLIVDGKLYHTTCFRCNKCNCLLNPGTYVESDTPGLYECAVCMPDENSDSMETVSIGSSDSKLDSLGDVPVKPNSPALRTKVLEKPQLSDKVTVARNSFLQHSLSPKSPEPLKLSSSFSRNRMESPGSVGEKDESTTNGVSVKAKISAFESSRNSKPESFFQTSELENSSKLKLSPSVNTLNTDVPLPNKSLRNSAISSETSPDSKLNGNLCSPDETSKNSFSVKTLGAPDLKTASKPLKLSISSSVIENQQSDKPNCDTLTSPSILNRVPSPSARRSLLLQSPSTKDEASKNFSSKQFVSDYKSPLRTSRDIFQTNLQPLKLSIPSITSSSKNESANSSLASNVTSPESAKTGGIEIPQIRSTYARTLPRPGSASSLLLKDKPNEASSHSETNLSDVLHSKWSRTAPRRSSFDSSSKTEIHNDSTDSKSINIEKIKDESSISKSSENKNLFFQRDQNTPIPSVRRSLENKDLNLGKPPSPPVELESPRKSINTSSQTPSPVQPENSPKVEKPLLEGATAAEQEKLYPNDLNPFGDDEEEEDEYPDDLNPFGDDDEEDTSSQPSKVTSTKPSKVIKVEDYDESKNPFADEDDDVDITPVKAKPPRPELPKLQRDISSPSGNSVRDSPFSSMSNSPSGTLKGTLKKRPAPRPPRVTDIFPNDSNDSEADVSINSLRSSPAMSRKSLQTPSPKLRKSKPAPPPPPVPSGKQGDAAANSKQMKDEDNMKLKSEVNGVKQTKAKKKRPAPPVPIPKRKDNKKIPLKEILREMKEIEEKQRECERQGRDIELLIRDRDKDEEASVEEEEYIMQLFELVNQKNALFRRQAELMYIKRSQRLEEQQSELETQIRQLLTKPEDEKTEEDRAKEEELILELKDIVDQRSSIIDSIEMDRRRELEEDASVQDQMEIKNGELPIAAEIKEKSSGKTKKFKIKKDKKKKKEENENGEPKKKEKKKWLSSK